MVMVLLGLNFGVQRIPGTLQRFAAGALLAILFLFNEGRLARYPIMPLGLFRNKSNAACLVIGFTHNFVRIPQRHSS